MLFRSNVVLLISDEHNPRYAAPYGMPGVHTPNMDRLAARSTVFRRAYCNAPLCSPSRTSALSGLSVQQTKVFYNETSPRIANPDIVFLPEHLARNGYTTKLHGKVYHTYLNSVTHPLPATTPATNLLCGGPARGRADGAFD